MIKLPFGARHPAVSFLLLLAVADDAIDLGIIRFRTGIHRSRTLSCCQNESSVLRRFIARRLRRETCVENSS